MEDDYLHVQLGEKYEKVTHADGVRTTHCRNRFEIVISSTGELSEQQAVQAIKDWVKWRKAEDELRDAGCVLG